jgi:hypothetical protein
VVPSQHRVGAYQQPDPAEQAAGEPVQHGGHECAVAIGELRPGGAELPVSLSRSLVGSNANTFVTLR